jgi:hypothetical protein
MATKAKSNRVQSLFHEQYESSARYQGDEVAKKDAANAKRVATSLSKAVSSFGRLLSADKLQTLREAAAVMDSLGADISAVTKLAVRCKADHDAQALRKRHDTADQRAAQRWADDQAMLLEAKDLADFFDRWHPLKIDISVKARYGAHLTFMSLGQPQEGGRLLDMLDRYNTGRASPEGFVAIRRRAAEYLDVLVKASQGARTYKDMHYVGMDDYEAWRAGTAAKRSLVNADLANLS